MLFFLQQFNHKQIIKKKQIIFYRKRCSTPVSASSDNLKERETSVATSRDVFKGCGGMVRGMVAGDRSEHSFVFVLVENLLSLRDS